MKTTKRLLLTVFVLVLLCLADDLFYLCYSPFTGTLTANTLNGDSTDFAFAQFVSNGGFDTLIWLLALAAVAVLWLPVFLNFGKNKQN